MINVYLLSCYLFFDVDYVIQDIVKILSSYYLRMLDEVEADLRLLIN